MQFLHEMADGAAPLQRVGRPSPRKGLGASIGPNASGRRGPCLAADRRRLLMPQIDLASALSHIESRVIRNDYAIAFAGRCFQIPRGGMLVWASGIAAGAA